MNFTQTVIYSKANDIQYNLIDHVILIIEQVKFILLQGHMYYIHENKLVLGIAL